MENKWLTPKEVTEKYPLLTERAQAQLRHRRQITYTLCAGKVIYKSEWVEEYLTRNMVKAAS